MKIPEQTRQWLTDSPFAYLRYSARMLFEPDRADNDEFYADSFVRENIEALQRWNDDVVERHNTPTNPFHRLATLADLGAKAGDAPMQPIVETILATFTEDATPLLTIGIPVAFGGSGKPTREWIICDFPTTLYALLKMGVKCETTDRAVKKLESLVGDSGFTCTGSIPKFHGPGPKNGLCPYANLIAAKALTEDEEAVLRPAAKTGADFLIRHWKERKEKKYFMFGIGTDFQKLKYPMVWYNLLHFLETLSRFPELRSSDAVVEMTDILMEKADAELRFKPESIYMNFKGMDFADKKNASQAITLAAIKILLRLGRIEL